MYISDEIDNRWRPGAPLSRVTRIHKKQSGRCVPGIGYVNPDGYHVTLELRS